MTFFSRLSDIVTVRLDEMLDKASDPSVAIVRIINEIEEGLGGARRSVSAAQSQEDRLQAELAERQKEVDHWAGEARDAVARGRDDEARFAIARKREAADLRAGLEQQLIAAASTREHMSTMLRAIEARLAEARRRQQDLAHPGAARERSRSQKSTTAASALSGREIDPQIEAELEALRRKVEKGVQ